MYIDTHSKESMLTSMCGIFQISRDELLDQLLIIDKVAADDDDYIEKLDDFIIRRAVNFPDEILLFHFSRRLHGTEDEVEGRNLADLLTTKNMFSSFLYKYGLQFVRGEQRIDVLYKGKLVDWDKCRKGNPSYMKVRLGYYKGREDYCFNGFAFKDLLYKNDYARNLFAVPEFVGQLIECLGCRSLEKEYEENSAYYCYEYRIPFELVMFDEHPNYSHSQKQRYLIRCVLQRLAQYQTRNLRNMFDHDNPILRLGDDYTVPSQYYVAREEITLDML